MATIYDRIRELRLARNMSQVELARRVGYAGKSAISKVENGERNINQSMIVKFAIALGTTPSYLLFGNEGNKVVRGSCLAVTGTVAAGNGAYAEENIIGWETVDEKYASDEYYYLLVSGDSMDPEIKDGDFVLVHRQEEVESGTLGIVIIDNEDGVVKKVVYGEDSITLVSFNPYFPARVFAGADAERVRVVGKVIESKRKFV
ncbi:MAG: helix-turn-helix domain-containing protein [Clostridia bacterium]|nr:helix-turn-helix domain-containing protein [Clostridia bacterium]